MALDQNQIVIDLAATHGATSGDIVVLWRELKLRHPVTGRWVTDRFTIGKLRLSQVRSELSLAEPAGKLDRPAVPGDIVELERGAVASESESAAPVPASAPPDQAAISGAGAPVVAPDAALVRAIFERLRGADLVTRIEHYEHFVRTRPQSPFARTLYEEAAFLRTLLKRTTRAPRPSARGFTAPKRIVAGEDVDIGIEIAGPVVGAVLHVRHAGQVTYSTLPMAQSGPGFYVARLAKQNVVPPRLEYFIEATADAGNAVPIVGLAAEPKVAEVLAVRSIEQPARYETTAQVLTDYADWNNLKGNDVAWQTEGFVGLRFRDVGIRALRSGFGVYRGVGGSLQELDELRLSPREVGLTYGYLEGEYAFSSFVAVVARGSVGLLDAGVSGGAQAFVRIGNDKQTNLLIGGEALGGVGLRGITQLELAAFERFPILFRTEVTNQPAGSAASSDDVRPHVPGAAPSATSQSEGDIGARAIAQLGYRIIPELVVAVRGSYQGRTIRHAGPGVGGAVAFTW